MNSSELKKYNWKNPPDHAMPRTQDVIDNYQKYLKSGAHEIFIDDVITKLSKALAVMLTRFAIVKNQFVVLENPSIIRFIVLDVMTVMLKVFEYAM